MVLCILPFQRGSKSSNWGGRGGLISRAPSFPQGGGGVNKTHTVDPFTCERGGGSGHGDVCAAAASRQIDLQVIDWGLAGSSNNSNLRAAVVG